MTTNSLPNEPKKLGFPIWFGLTGTVASLLVGYSVLTDNLKGFRDAGNFATLLSAIFSIISTVWLITTVLRQGEALSLQRQELSLQRQELRLQREETTKIANETKDQSGFLKLQIKITHQNFLISQIRAIFSSEESNFFNDINDLYNEAATHYSNYLQRLVRISDVIAEPRAAILQFSLRDEFLIRNQQVDQISSFSLLWQDIDIDTSQPRYRILNKLYQSSKNNLDLDNWFIDELAFSSGEVGKLTIRSIWILLNLVALKSQLE